jgi:hypothetical protein
MHGIVREWCGDKYDTEALRAFVFFGGGSYYSPATSFSLPGDIVFSYNND